MFIGQLHANLCPSLINTCTNHLHIVLNFLSFDLSILDPSPSLALDPPLELYYINLISSVNSAR